MALTIGSVQRVTLRSADVVIVSEPFGLASGEAAYVVVPLRNPLDAGFRETPEDFKFRPVGGTADFVASLWQFGPVLERDMAPSQLRVSLADAEAIRAGYEALLSGSQQQDPSRFGKKVHWWQKRGIASFRARARREWEILAQRVRQEIAGEASNDLVYSDARFKVMVYQSGAGPHFAYVASLAETIKSLDELAAIYRSGSKARHLSAASGLVGQTIVFANKMVRPGGNIDVRLLQPVGSFQERIEVESGDTVYGSSNLQCVT
jgi:hypothetical protein